MSKNVMVIGTGTIGEPLIGLLAEHKDALGLDNVVFFKRPFTDSLEVPNFVLQKSVILYLHELYMIIHGEACAHLYHSHAHHGII